jgi:L-ascorbate metabolism protein UlaG (beta-lactamase superfamily)
MVGEWNADDGCDAAWLLYSANYLLRTGSARWAIDPLTMRWRVAGAAAVPSGRDLANLAFVVLTHRHSDHLDLDLLRSLRGLPIPWIVPEALRQQVVERGGLAKSNVVVATHHQPIEIQGVRLTPFPGLHYERLVRRAAAEATASVRGVPATGYLVEWGGKRWLFPGDTRDYRARFLPSFGPVSGLFAHVWLGRGAALDDDPPLLDAQSQFCLDLHPERVILAHLEEFGRPAADVWRLEHAARLRTRLLNSGREVVVGTATTGDRVFL